MVDALILVVEHVINKGVIQIGSEQPTLIRELAGIIVDISGKKIMPNFDERQPQGLEIS